MKMLILRGKAGYYDDTDWPDGALHEQPALDYATRRGYDGKVLPMPGKAYKGSPQHLAVQASQDLGVHVSQLRD